MRFPSDTDGADLPMVGYVGMLATIVGLLAVGLYWLQKPYIIPNPGVAAYNPGTKLAGPLATSPDTAMAMERSAKLAAGIAGAEREATPPEQKPGRTAQSN